MKCAFMKYEYYIRALVTAAMRQCANGSDLAKPLLDLALATAFTQRSHAYSPHVNGYIFAVLESSGGASVSSFSLAITVGDRLPGKLLTKNLPDYGYFWTREYGVHGKTIGIVGLPSVSTTSSDRLAEDYYDKKFLLCVFTDFCNSHPYPPSIGLAGGAQLDTSVIPFLLRGVNLLGIDSVMCPFEKRQVAWQRIAKELPIKQLEAMVNEIELAQVPEMGDKILNGEVQERTVIKVS